MALGVPMARRTLLADRRRSLLAMGGIGTGLLMVLVMSGLFAGFARQETAYVDQLDADVIVSQQGVRTMQMSLSALPEGAQAAAGAAPGVAWVEPLRQLTSTIGADDHTLVSYVFGVAPDGRAAPASLEEGRLPTDGEVVLDRGAASQLGLRTGDEVEVFGAPLRIVGLSRGFTSLANTATFITASDFERLSGPGTNYLLIGAHPGVDPEALAASIAEAAPGTTAQSRARFTAEEAAFLDSLYREVIAVMVFSGYLVALALVVLTLGAISRAHRRDHGILKAMGATPGDLARVVAGQALWSVIGAFAVALAASILLARAAEAWLPNIDLVLEPATVGATLLGAMVVGLLGALGPVRKVARVDAASSFRRAAG